MISDSYSRKLAALHKELGALHRDISRQQQASTKARSEAAKRMASAARSSSASTRQSYLRSAATEEAKSVAAEKKLGELRRKVGNVTDDMARAQRSLSAALKSEQAAADRKEEARRRREKSEQEAQDREGARRRRQELAHVRELSRLATVTVRHVLERPPEPETLRVLYLTSSPDEDDPIRVDAEVNNVLKALRSAKHRDLIELYHRPAATPQDLLDGINDLRPHVIHFSGHGDAQGLLFDDASLDSPVGNYLLFSDLARILKATDQPPKLVVLNACKSIDGATFLLDAVPVVIAMADDVGDMSAGLFSTHLYAAIGGAQSIGHAVEQAKSIIRIALPDEADLVAVRTADGVSPDEVRLVLPH